VSFAGLVAVDSPIMGIFAERVLLVQIRGTARASSGGALARPANLRVRKRAPCGRFSQVYQRHIDTLQFLRDVTSGELVIAGGNARSARITKMTPPFTPPRAWLCSGTLPPGDPVR
jgi:hypothetical protein